MNDEQASYAEHLWDGYDFVKQHSVTSLKIMKETANFLKERASIEEQYGKALRKLGRSYGHVQPEGTLGKGFLEMRVNTERIGILYHENAERITREAVSMIESVRDQQSKMQKQLHGEGNQVVKDLDAARSAASKAQTRYAQSNAKVEQYELQLLELEKQIEAASSQQSRANSSKQRDKVKSKLSSQLKDKTNCDRSYQKAVDYLRQTRGYYDSRMSGVLSGLQQIEEKRIGTIAEGLASYSVTMNSALSLVRDVANKAQLIVHKIDAKADVQDIIRSHTTYNKPKPEMRYRTLHSAVTGAEEAAHSHRRRSSASFPIIQEPVMDAEETADAETAIRATMAFLERSAPSDEGRDSGDTPATGDKPNGDGETRPPTPPPAPGETRPPTPPPAPGEHAASGAADRTGDGGTGAAGAADPLPLSSVLCKPWGRKHFARQLNNVRESHARLSSKWHYDTLVEHFRSTLTQSCGFKEFSTARLLLNMACTYFYVPASSAEEGDGNTEDAAGESEDMPPEKKVYLQQGLKNDPLWSNMRVWEEIFYDSIMTEHRRQRASSIDSEQDARVAHGKIAFGQLIPFIWNMIDFGVSAAEAKRFADRMCLVHSVEGASHEMLMQQITAMSIAAADERDEGAKTV